MKKLLMALADFKAGNPAKFLFLALDEASSLEAIKNKAEKKETISETDVKRRYDAVVKVMDTAKTTLANKPEALEKYEEGVQRSLLGEVSSDFPLITLENMDRDAETGVDYTEFSTGPESYIKYLNQMLNGLSSMPELNANYQTPEEKRKAYQFLSDYANNSDELKGVVDLVENGVEIETIEARIKIYQAISGESLNKLKTDLDGSWYQLDYAEEVIVQVGKIRGKLFNSAYKGDASIDTDFTGWDGAGDPNFSQWGKEHMSEQEFLQRLLVYSGVSGSEVGQAFSTAPSVSKQKTTLEKQIQYSSFSEEQRQELGIPESNVLSGESLTNAVEKLANLKKAERLEKFLDSLEKWDGMEVEGFTEIKIIRNQLRNNPENLSAALTAIDRILEDFSDYYETNDNFWDWGILNYVSPVHQMAEMSGAFDNFGQGKAEWIMASDTHLGIALRAVKDTQQAGEVMRDEMMQLKLISAKKEEDRTPEEKTFLAEHSEEMPAIKTISENAKQYENKEGRKIAEKRYQDLLESLRDKSGGDLPPEYLQILSAGKENVIKGISSRLSFQHATEEYIETNGTDNLAGSTLLDQYNDMKGLDGFWNWSDENVEMGKEIAKMIVVIIVTEIATLGLASFFATAEGAALAGEVAEGASMFGRIGIKGGKFAGNIVSKIANYTGKGGKLIRGLGKGVQWGVRQGKGAANILGKGNGYLAKGASWLTKGKVSPKFIEGITSGAFRFTATEAALFGVDSPDKFLVKFAQNVEMFALFGAAGKLSGKIAGRFGRVYGKGGKAGGEILESLATKANPKFGQWVAQQGIALGSEAIVFGAAQSLEQFLYRGDKLEDFHWKDLAQMMTFSMIMRLAHAGFPKLAGKLTDVKNKEIRNANKEIKKLEKENKKLEKIISNPENSKITDFEYNNARAKHRQNIAEIQAQKNIIESVNFEANIETKTNENQVKNEESESKQTENKTESREKTTETKSNNNKTETVSINRRIKQKGEFDKARRRQAQQNEKSLESELNNLQKEKFDPNKELPDNVVKEFDNKIYSAEGVTVNGKNYRIEYEKINSRNPNRNTNKYKLFIDGEIKTSDVYKTKSISDNSAGKKIKKAYYEARTEFAKEKFVHEKRNKKAELTEKIKQQDDIINDATTTEINNINQETGNSRENLNSKRTRVKEYIKKRLKGFKEFFKSKKVKEKLKTKEGKKEVVEHVAKDVQAKTGLSRNQALKIGGAMLAVYGINALGSYLDEDDKPEDVDIDAILDDIFAESDENVIPEPDVIVPPVINPIYIPEEGDEKGLTDEDLEINLNFDEIEEPEEEEDDPNEQYEIIIPEKDDPNEPKTEVLDDGTVVTTYPDGTKVEESSDGTRTETSPDGTVTVMNSDGDIISTTDPNGVITNQNGDIINSDGTIKTKKDYRKDIRARRKKYRSDKKGVRKDIGRGKEYRVQKKELRKEKKSDIKNLRAKKKEAPRRRT